ncbi:hypothetical protein ACPYO6_13295 [Georgenia sp. Z1344]|uniref:hypothetical protein n=1 Tax=Georgenia sp. Z1344 TaxID=3416706 RepID=UPI003CF2E08B
MSTVRSPRRAALAAAAATALVLAACGTGGDDTDAGQESGSGGGSAESESADNVAESVAPTESLVLEGDGTARSVAASETYFASSPIVVLAPDGAPRSVEATSAAVHLGVPVLVDGDDAAEAAEIERLGASTVVAVGPVTVPDDVDVDVAAPADDAELAALVGGPELAEVGAADAVQTVAASADELAVAAHDWDPAAASDASEEGGGAQDGAETPSDATDGGATDESPSDAPGETATDSADGADATDDATTDGPAETGDHEIVTQLPDLGDTEPAGAETVALGGGTLDELAVAATARAAGANVVVANGGDPRASAAGVEAVHSLANDLGLASGGESDSDAPGESTSDGTGTEESDTGADESASDPSGPGAEGTDAAGLVVVGLSPDLGDAEQLRSRTESAATGVQLPAGGQLVLPEPSGDQAGAMYVALYGSPDGAALGVLGEQGPEDTITRAEEVAAEFDGLTDETVVPTLEIIATVASSEAGDDGDYSSETPVERIRPLVDLAAEHGMYVVLDLQPGRTDFVTQARLYEELLLEPHVGLALDPEWRLRPDQVHLTQIGQVPVEEVNEVVTYLADLTDEHDLPQKLLVLHQFQVRMIPDVDQVDQSRDEVRVLIHADGQGGQGDKQATWRTLLANAPSVTAWGWKNFYDEDTPLLGPDGTMAVQPTPDLVTYQ